MLPPSNAERYWICRHRVLSDGHTFEAGGEVLHVSMAVISWQAEGGLGGHDAGG